MKHSIWMAGILLLMVIGCREESDIVLSYAFKDNMAFNKADASFAGKFDVFWNGMNANYGLWDYEKENGLDWDEVYEQYYPRFAALDAADTLVSDKQLKDLLNEVVSPLHDGHMFIQMKNHVTGHYIMSNPGALRVEREREDEYLIASSKKSSLPYYITTGDVLEAQEVSTASFVPNLVGSYNSLMFAVLELKHKPDLTPQEEANLLLFSSILEEITAIIDQVSLDNNLTKAMDSFNELALRYEYLHIPGLSPIDKKLNEYAITISYALFKGNIAYLSLDSFSLSAYLNPSFTQELFEKPSAQTQELIENVRSIWKAWFNAIQEHHKAGDLGGVIIDVRSNGGGMMNDYMYVLGALLPSGGYHESNSRFKRGPGRYDYSPVMPQIMPTMDEEHVIVTEPIVGLCNCSSASMAEHTSIGIKLLDNGCLIGTRTWGGFSALSGSDQYSQNYAGYVGVRNETPVFCFIPQEVAFTPDGQIVESIGITPDIEVAFDWRAWRSGNGPDSQLDRALQYIRNGH